MFSCCSSVSGHLCSSGIQKGRVALVCLLCCLRPCLLVDDCQLINAKWHHQAKDKLAKKKGFRKEERWPIFKPYTPPFVSHREKKKKEAMNDVVEGLYRL